MAKYDEREILILIRDRTRGVLLDYTLKLQWFSEDSKSVRVKYYGNDTFYYVSYRDIYIFRKPEKFEITEETYFNGHRITGYIDALRFKNWVKVFFTEGSRIFKMHQISNYKSMIEQGPNSILRFSYFKELAKESARYDIDFLSSMYDNLDYTSSFTSLEHYLAKKEILNRTSHNTYIYPFGLNLSQKEAVKNAFSYNVSVIEGPPGTGKTQTILNIIANAVYRGKNVAVISNNNAAIANIKEKLEEFNLDFITAMLGNVDNKTYFFENEVNKLKPINFLNENSEKLNYNDLSEKAKYYSNELPKLYEDEKRLAVLLNMKEEYKVEFGHYQKSNKKPYEKNFVKIINKLKKTEQVLHLKTGIEYNAGFNWIKRLIFRLKYKLNINVFSSDKLEQLLVCLDQRFYEMKIEEINKEIIKIQKRLQKENFEEAKLNYENISMELLKRILYIKYKSLEPIEYNYENYRNKFGEFIKEYPVILSTSYSLIPSANRGHIFDYLIIDEASQTDLLSSVLALSCAQNLVVVGDTLQLSQIENQNLFNVNEELKRYYQIEDEYDYLKNNILTSVIKVYKNIPRVLLREHYRCHPKIINFCNQKFYNNELIILTKDQGDIKPLRVYKTVPGNHARKNPNGSGMYNQREIDEIAFILDSTDAQSVGVITPYRYQANLMAGLYCSEKKNLEVDTVHKFQGRAKDIIILSTVANEIANNRDTDDKREDFIARSDLLNVAVSRARKQLNLVVSDKIFNSKNNSISDLIKYMIYNSDSTDISEGKVKSIFDLLYSDYMKEMDSFRKRHNKKNFDSENIALDCINTVVKSYEKTKLKVFKHYPLRYLISLNASLSERERSYASNKWSHVDFLIMNSLTKEPVLVIEVDGVSFHEQDSKQTERDQLKNRLLEMNNVKLLRLKTNESKEESRIREALDEALI